jgi:hypothetical protein
MIHPVHPVIHKVLEYDQYDPVDPGVFDRFRKMVIIKERKNKADIDDPEKQVDPAVKQHKINILRRILQAIRGLLPELAEEQFQPDHHEVKRRSYKNK